MNKYEVFDVLCDYDTSVAPKYVGLYLNSLDQHWIATFRDGQEVIRDFEQWNSLRVMIDI